MREHAEEPMPQARTMMRKVHTIIRLHTQGSVFQRVISKATGVFSSGGRLLPARDLVGDETRLFSDLRCLDIELFHFSK